MKSKRILSIVLALCLCVGLLPAVALGASAITICGETWTTSTYAKTVNGQVVTDASAEDYNLYWNADEAVLTLQNASLEVQDLAAIDAQLELLTLHLIGSSTITSSKTQASTDDAVVSSSKDLIITGADSSASLTIKATHTAQGGDLTGISAGGQIQNSAVLDLQLSVAEQAGSPSSFLCDVYGLKTGTRNTLPGALDNAGTITVSILNESLFTHGNTTIYGIYIQDGPLSNSGALDLTVSSPNGDAYGLRGNMNGMTQVTWVNDGTIKSNATAYGGNYPGFASSYKNSNYAVAFSIEAGRNSARLENNGRMDLYAVNHTENTGLYEYAIGLEMYSSASALINRGTMDIQALEAYTYGIWMSNLTDDATLQNFGDISIVVTTCGLETQQNGPSLATGINLDFSNSETNPAVYKTQLKLESGSRLDISAAPSDRITDEEWAFFIYYQCCTAIQLQKVFYAADPYGGVAPQDITMADDLVILEGEGDYEGGEPVAVYEDFYVPYLWLYVNTIGHYFQDSDTGEMYSVPSKEVVILPRLTGTVALTGETRVGSTLTAQVSGLPAGVPVTYQWQVGDTADGPFTDIAGATGESYTLTSDVLGKSIRLVVAPAAGSGYGGSLMATTGDLVLPTEIYPPTVQDSAGGTTTVDPRRPQPQQKVTITPNPDAGYELGAVSVTDLDGNVLDLTDNGDGTYSFIQPTGRVIITVTYVEKACGGTVADNCPSAQFTDLDTTQWYHLYTDYVIENGLMDGTGDAVFSPNGTLTRAQVVMVLWRLEGTPLPDGAAAFDDVDIAQWYGDAISWAAAEQIVEGYSDTRFGPNDPITREQLAAVLWRYAQYKGYDVSGGQDVDLSAFDDADVISAYAYPAFQWAYGAGIIEGDSAKTLNPTGDASRCAFAAMITRFLENL